MVAESRASGTVQSVDTTAMFDIARDTSEEARRRTSLTTTIAACLAVATSMLAILRAFLLENQAVGVTILALGAFLFAFSAWLGQRPRDAWLGSAMIPLVALLSTFALAAAERGLYTESLYWVPFAPLVTSFIVPEIKPLHVAVLTASGVFGLVLGHLYGFFPIGESLPEFYLRSGSLLGTVAFGGALGFYIERANRRARKMWWYRATHHPLTGLRNRHAFLDTLRLALDRSRRGNHGAALLFLDLDGLKLVNDNHGHEAGDALLREAASRIRDQVRAGDVPCHLGGDEFTVILEPCANAAVAQEVGERVRVELAKPLAWRGDPIAGVSASIGIALFNGSETPEQLISRADTAMYTAKRAGKNRTEVAA